MLFFAITLVTSYNWSVKMAISPDSISKLDNLGHPFIKEMIINLSEVYDGIDDVADTAPISEQLTSLIDALCAKLSPAYVAMESLCTLISTLDFLRWTARCNGKSWNPLEQSFQSFCLKQQSELGIEAILDEASPSLAAFLYNEEYLNVAAVDEQQAEAMLKQWFNL